MYQYPPSPIHARVAHASLQRAWLNVRDFDNNVFHSKIEPYCFQRFIKEKYEYLFDISYYTDIIKSPDGRDNKCLNLSAYHFVFPQLSPDVRTKLLYAMKEAALTEAARSQVNILTAQYAEASLSRLHYSQSDMASMSRLIPPVLPLPDSTIAMVRDSRAHILETERKSPIPIQKMPHEHAAPGKTGRDPSTVTQGGSRNFFEYI